MPAGPVRITWNGIASLWLFSQAAARFGRQMHGGKRSGAKQLNIVDHPELQLASDSLVLATRFLTSDVPQEAAQRKRWPEWAPKIDPSARPRTDGNAGNSFFLGTLTWIFMHELAHIHLKHDTRQVAESMSDAQCESEADRQATLWIKEDFRADVGRAPGTKPSDRDLGLEVRATYVGLGLIWVALFEANIRRGAITHPPPTQRVFDCFEILGLPDDSMAAEVISDVICAWIDPEGRLGRETVFATPIDSLNAALVILHRQIDN